MPEERPRSDDEDLRRSIRAEIEQRDLLRKESYQQRATRRSDNAEAERKRRIYQDELRKFYQNREGYREVIGEDGEVDWIPEEESSTSEMLLDEVLEDPAVARRRLKLSLGFTALLVLAVVTSVYLFLHEGSGSIQVLCNVTDARIILDGTPIGHGINDLIEEVPAGEHVITIEKPGYRIEGQTVRKIELKGGGKEVVLFTLVPVVRDNQETATPGSAAATGEAKP